MNGTCMLLLRTLGIGAVIAGAISAPARADVVAAVDGEAPIEANALDRWAQIQAKQSNQPASDPAVRREALHFLLGVTWTLAEARERGLVATEEEIAEQRSGGSSGGDSAPALREAGMTQADATLRATQQVLELKLLRQFWASRPLATPEEVRAFYTAHRAELRVHERRTVRVLAAATRHRAEQALRALRKGRSWDAVGRRYSASGSSDTGPQLFEREHFGPVVTAARRARRGELVGPVRDRGQYHVLKVERIFPARAMTRVEGLRESRDRLEERRQQDDTIRFEDDFEAKWRARARCLGSLLIPRCGGVLAPA